MQAKIIHNVWKSFAGPQQQQFLTQICTNYPRRWGKPLWKTLAHNKQEKRGKGRTDDGKFRRGILSCGQHGVKSSCRRVMGVTKSEQRCRKSEIQHMHTQWTYTQFTLYCTHTYAVRRTQAQRKFTPFVLLWLDRETGVYMVAFGLMVEARL